MAKYNFRILGNTYGGKTFSYYSASLVDTDMDLVLSASEVWHRITGSVSCSYHDSYEFPTFGTYNTTRTFKDDLYLSSSLSGSLHTGVLDFITNGITGSDSLKRIKFFG